MRLGWHAAAAALVLTLLNALKPLHIDDTFILEVARQVFASPSDPYGFDIFWLQWPQPVFEELTPPVVPYWWALGLAWLPPVAFAWKLWFLPFAVGLAWGLCGLVRLWVPGREPAYLWAAMISPVVLPGFNLMQDIPALALALVALRLYLHAAERNRLAPAIAAGCVAGLATQTKYTAVAMLAAILLHGLLARRKQLAVTCVSMAVLIFFGWEWAMTLRYGQGMFLGQVDHGLFWVPRGQMILPLIQLVGGVAGMTIPLALRGLGASGRLVFGSAVAVAFAVVALPAIAPGASAACLTAVGAGCFVVGLAAIVRLIGEGESTASGAGRGPAVPWGVWLAAWAAVEIAVYFASAPFPAARRAIGVCLLLYLAAVAANGIGSRVPRNSPSARPARWIAVSYGLALALGLWVQGVDWIEARAQRDGAIWGAELAEVGRAPDARVWYLGHWGFQHYAERAGMQPLVPDRTALRPGDRLVVPTRVDRPDIVLRPDEAKTLYARSWNDPVPWTTIPGYYGGRLPVRGFRAPRLEVRVLEVLRPVVPPSDWSPSRLSTWARTAGGRTAAAAAPALFRIVETGRGEDRRIAMSGIVDLELQPAEYEPRLLAWSRDADPAIRLGAIVALARFPSPAAKAALEAARADEDPAVAEAARRLLGAGP